MKLSLTKADVHGLNDEQQSAIVEALVTAVLADGKVEKPEVEHFNKEMLLVEWGKTPDVVSAMVAAAQQKVAGLNSRDAVVAFIDGVAAKITNQGLREKVLKMMAGIIFADRDYSQEEKNVVHAFAAAFKIPEGQLESIRAEVQSSQK